MADHQNTVRDIASFNGSVTAIANHRTFSSYGQMLAQTNAATDLLFGFTGRELDPQTGLNYYRDRWYDPLTGKFNSEDPIGFAGGDTNLSRYVGNSPVDYTDPTGNSWLSSLLRKAKREVSRVVGQVREVVSDAFRDVRDFAQEHPVLTGLAALATGTWFVAASGGIAGAFANVGTLVNKAIGSIMVNPFTPASSGIGGTYSVSVGSFAKLSVGAGVSGTSAFAGANVSVLGLPVWGIGPTVGIFGNVADPIASTLAGNFTDSVSRTLLSGSGSIDVGSFVRSVAVGTVNDFAYSQLNQTGLPLVVGVASQTAAFTSDVYGAFRDVLAPPLPVYVTPPVTAQQVANQGQYDPVTGLTRLSDDPDAIYLQPPRSIWSNSALVQPGIYYRQAGASDRGLVRHIDGAAATGTGPRGSFFQQAYELAYDYSPHRIPLNLVENVSDIVRDQFYFEAAGGSTTAADGSYQPTIKGTVIPGVVVVPTDDASYVTALVQQGRISEMAADQAINDIIQGHTARLYVADRENGLHEYLDFRQKAFQVDLVRGAVGGVIAAPFEAAAGAVALGRAGTIASRATSRTLLGSGGLDRIPYPRTQGLGTMSTTAELLQSGAIPGVEGVVLNQRFVKFTDIWAMTENKGIEFALTRENGTYILRSGSQTSVPIPRGVRPIVHTHPVDPLTGARSVLPSRADINTLNNLWNFNPNGPPPVSQIITGPGETTIFRATGTQPIPAPKVRNR